MGIANMDNTTIIRPLLDTSINFMALSYAINLYTRKLFPIVKNKKHKSETIKIRPANYLFSTTYKSSGLAFKNKK
jgi:hypothetical protein